MALVDYWKEILRHVKGAPNQKHTTAEEWRWGTNGSFAAKIGGDKAGTWFDHEQGRGGGILDFLYIEKDLKPEEIGDWLERELGVPNENRRGGGRQDNQRERVVATYTYVDERGQTLFWVYRWGPTKTFRQGQPDGNGGVKRGPNPMKGCRYVPYHLDKLAAAAGSPQQPWRVYIVEGEKDADRLINQWGLLATTGPGGAEKWHGAKYGKNQCYNPHFRGAEVVIIPDNDESGEKHAKHIANELVRVAHSVRIIQLWGLPDKGDVSDWLDAGASQSDLEDLVDATDPIPKPAISGGLFNIVEAKNVTPRPVNWLWSRTFALGKLNLITGNPGLSKSTVALNIAATVSRGGALPDGSRAPFGRVVIFSAEDDIEDTIVPRLIAADANCDMITIINDIPDTDESGNPIERAFDMNRDGARLEEQLEQYGDVKMVLLDPLTGFLGDVDSHKNAEVRAALHPTVAACKRQGIALLGITHNRKSSDGDAALNVSGSLAFSAAARAVFSVFRDDEVPRRRKFLPAKNNLGDDRIGWAYHIEPVTLPMGVDTIKVVWEIAALSETANDELERQRGSAKQTQRDNALKNEKALAKTLLANGPVSTDSIRDAAKQAGFGWAKMRAAIEDIGGVTGCIDGVYVWLLPENIDPETFEEEEGEE